MMKTVAAALVSAIALSASAWAAGREEVSLKEPDTIVGMEKAEINTAVRKAMPLPVVRILSWKEMGLRKWAVEMSTTPLVAPKEQAVHVTFQTRDEGGRAELMQAFAYAGQYAKGLVAEVSGAK